MVINIVNHQKKIYFSAALTANVRKTARRALNSKKNTQKSVITICFVTDRIIRQLNKKYLKKNRATDVIAFNTVYTKPNNYINADIAISTDTAVSNAKIYKTSVVYELLLYVAHGALHIIGYNDNTARNRNIMRKKEIEILTHLYKLSTVSNQLLVKDFILKLRTES